MKLRLSLSGETLDPDWPELWQQFDAVGMIRSEFLVRRAGAYWSQAATRNAAAAYVAATAAFFFPRPVWYRTSDLWSDEANPLEGIDEVCIEDNPIIGQRGARRGLALPASFQAEVSLIATVAKHHPNLHLMTPFVGDADEFARAAALIRRAEWPNQIGSMIEIPSAVLDAAGFVAAGATNLMLGLNDLSCLLTGAERSSTFDSKMSQSVWWCIDYVRREIGTSCEWGIAGGLSKPLLQRAETAGVPYASLHYSELPQLLDVHPSQLRDLGLVRQIKNRTRERKVEFMRHRSLPSS